MNFERIYNECNLPAESKPLKSFKEIFSECNVKMLNEQVLREMPVVSSKQITTWSESFLQRVKIKTNNLLKNLPESVLSELDKEIENLFARMIQINHAVTEPFALSFKTKQGETLLAANENHFNSLKDNYSGYLIVSCYEKDGKSNPKIIEKWFDLIIGELRPKEGQQGFDIMNRYYNVLKRVFVELYKDLPDMHLQKSLD